MTEDERDGWDERMNPYDGTCKKHGSWKGPHDECPKCMEEDAEREMAEYDPWYICDGCKKRIPITKEEYMDENGCEHYKTQEFFAICSMTGDREEANQEEQLKELCPKCYEKVEAFIGQLGGEKKQ